MSVILPISNGFSVHAAETEATSDEKVDFSYNVTLNGGADG